MFKSNFKNFKPRASKHSFKDRNTFRRKKPAIKDIKKSKFQRAYSADSDSEREFDDEKSKFNKSKAYVAGSDKASSEEHSEDENEAADMAVEDDHMTDVLKNLPSDDLFFGPGPNKSMLNQDSAKIAEYDLKNRNHVTKCYKH